MGTPDFAVPALQALVELGYEVAAVVTQPDREKGRKRVLTPPPVKVEAEKFGIPVLQPAKLRSPEAVAQLQKLAPDLIVTAAYGQILPKSVLELPAHGCINVHASLLPKYRGGAPIHHAVINGDKLTGVTIMYMAEGLDTGDMISKIEVPIEAADTTGSMFDKLSEAGAALLKRTLPDLLDGKLAAAPQNHEAATYAPNISREDEKIDWRESSERIYNRVRGLNPWPGAFTYWEGAVFKVWECLPPQTGSAGVLSAEAPGTVERTDRQGIWVRTGDGLICLTRIQPAGKKAMGIDEFSRGTEILRGTRFGVNDGA